MCILVKYKTALFYLQNPHLRSKGGLSSKKQDFDHDRIKTEWGEVVPFNQVIVGIQIRSIFS